MVVQNSRGGFTLLELIVVLVIMGIMSALVVPKLTGPMGNLDLKTASKKISASLRYARSQAASEKTTYAALFDFANNSLVIVNPSPADGDFSVDDQEAMEKMLEEQRDKEKDHPGRLKTYKLPDGIKLAKVLSKEGEVNAGIFPLFFFPSGGSSGGEIILANEQGRRYKVTVDFITGAVQLSEAAG